MPQKVTICTPLRRVSFSAVEIVDHQGSPRVNSRSRRFRILLSTSHHLHSTIRRYVPRIEPIQIHIGVETLSGRIGIELVFPSLLLFLPLPPLLLIPFVFIVNPPFLHISDIERSQALSDRDLPDAVAGALGASKRIAASPVDRPQQGHHALLVLDGQRLEPDQAKLLDEVHNRLVEGLELALAEHGALLLEAGQQIFEILDLGVEGEVERQGRVFVQVVDLGQHVDVRQVHLEHTAQAEQERGDV